MTDSPNPPRSRANIIQAEQLTPDGLRPDVVVEPYTETSELLRRWHVLRRYIWLLPLAFAAGVGVAWYQRGNQVPVYQSNTTVRFRDARATLTSGVGNVNDASNWRFDPVKSQIELLGARTTRERAVDSAALQLRPVPPAAINWLSNVNASAVEAADTLRLKFGTGGASVRFSSKDTTVLYGVPVKIAGLSFVIPQKPQTDSAKFGVATREETIAALAGVQVSRRPDTDIGDFSLQGSDPTFVPRALNALTQAIQGLSRTSDQQFAGDRRKFLDDQLRMTDSLLETKRLQLAGFRSRTQTFDARQQVSQQQQTLANLRTRREELAADKLVFESLLASALVARQEGDPSKLKSLIGAPGIGDNALLMDLYSRLQRASELRDSLTTGPFPSAATNPDVQRVAAQIESLSEQFVSAVRSQLGTFEARIAALDGLATRTAESVSAMPATQAEEQRLEQEANATQILADQLRQEQQRARISEVAEGGKVEIIDLAPPTAILVSGSSSRKLVFGGLLALTLAVGLIFLYDELNTSLRRKSDVERLLSLPTLGSIPALHHGNSGPKRKLLGRTNGSNGSTAVVPYASSPVFESYRAIRTSLIFSNAVDSLRTIAITSASPGDGKSTTVANLATAFAQQNLRVLAIDCDFRRGTLHRLFKVPRSPGFTNVIAVGGDLSSVARETSVPGLSVVTAGTQPPNPGELLGSHRVIELLADAKEQYDLLIIDTPPVLAAADASIIASMVDGVILLIRVGVTTRSAAKSSQERLRLVGARLLGTVLNDPTDMLDASEQYYYYDYSSTSGTK
jgi:succinoglycan biosynthesis transport protein ExoP